VLRRVAILVGLPVEWCCRLSGGLRYSFLLCHPTRVSCVASGNVGTQRCYGGCGINNIYSRQSYPIRYTLRLHASEIGRDAHMLISLHVAKYIRKRVQMFSEAKPGHLPRDTLKNAIRSPSIITTSTMLPQHCTTLKTMPLYMETHGRFRPPVHLAPTIMLTIALLLQQYHPNSQRIC
jgi:hypothetical protein